MLIGSGAPIMSLCASMESQERSVDQYLKGSIQQATGDWAAVAALERRLNVTLKVADQTWDEVVVSWD